MSVRFFFCWPEVVEICKSITQKKFMPLMMLQLSNNICSFYYCASSGDVTNAMAKAMAQKDTWLSVCTKMRAAFCQQFIRKSVSICSCTQIYKHSSLFHQVVSLMVLRLLLFFTHLKYPSAQLGLHLHWRHPLGTKWLWMNFKSSELFQLCVWTWIRAQELL